MIKPWNPHNAKKHKAHELAKEIWPWTDYRERNRMYGWIKKHSSKFGSKLHIRHMNMDELSVLIYEMGQLKERIDRKAEKEPKIKKDAYVKARPWLVRYSKG